VKETRFMLQQDRKCTYNVTFRHVGATSVAVKKAVRITYSECVCSLRYLGWNAHAPYCHLWPVWLYNIFPHYLINSRIKKK